MAQNVSHKKSFKCFIIILIHLLVLMIALSRTIDFVWDIYSNLYIVGSVLQNSVPVVHFIVTKLPIVLVKVVLILISVAYFTIAERKIMAAIQRRKGPNIVGFWGLLQPLADGLKLLVKKLLIPTKANSFIFILAPILILTLSLISWSIIPFGFSKGEFALTSNYLPNLRYSFYFDKEIDEALFQYAVNNPFIASDDLFKPLVKNSLFFYQSAGDINCGLLFLLAVSSMNVYGIIISGWASNSKYAFLGSLRSAAQMISYEVSIGLVILPVILLAGSLNLNTIVYVQTVTTWFLFPLLPCFIIFFISMLAETNRAPFDLPEAEAELVAGYNVEYSSIIFAMFFLGEYSNMLLMSTLICIMFFGGWDCGVSFLSFLPSASILAIKIGLFCFFFILVRAAFPRYRYDQLMNIGWKIFLPITTAYLLFLCSVLIVTDSLIIVETF